jgi:uncharacterized protein with ATP-grasp and redox domains
MACLMTQLENAFRLLKPNTTNNEIVQAQKEAMGKISLLTDERSPYYGQQLYNFIGKKLGLVDPYAQLKEKYNQIALDLYPQIEKIARDASDPLLTAMVLAILGNTIDFGTTHNIDVGAELTNFSLDKLAINHYAEFTKEIVTAKKILVLGDNAGEIVFDKAMIQLLKQRFTKKQFIYAVRGGPAINDSTMQDAKFVRMLDLCPVVEGAAAPGILLEESSPAFLDAFHSADLIISKGQGNFESVEDIPTPNAPVYFLLKAKCDLIAKTFQVPFGSLLFYRRPSDITIPLMN